ncbi:MAG: TorF family putative porin [Pseudobdellovibrionaceae bacterium]
MKNKNYIFLLIFFICSSTFAQSRRPANTPTFALSGDATLLSHYVEHGLSETNKDPALQGSFWFNFGPQFRLGVWGSNVHYAGGDEHFKLKLATDVSIDFSDKANVVVYYSFNKFYTSSLRDGSTVGLNFNYDKWGVLYESNSNWDGYQSSSNYYAFILNSKLGTFTWKNQVGYTMVNISTISNFFDARTTLGYASGSVLYEASATTTSNSSQLGGRGDLFFLVAISTKF